MKIVPYTDEDMQGLIQVFKSNVPVYFANHEQGNFLEYLKKNKLTYFVMKDSGVIIGGGGYHLVSPKLGRLSWDLISPKFHKMGYGSELIEFCLHQLYLIPKVELVEVWTSQHVQGFYKKFGFENIESKNDYWAAGLDLFRMRMHLS